MKPDFSSERGVWDTASGAETSASFPAAQKVSKDYGVELSVSTYREMVREQPKRHIPGDGGVDSLHFCVERILENAVDEAVAGCCTHIEVTLDASGVISIRDNGRGISVEPTTDPRHRESGMSELEYVFQVPRFLQHLAGNYFMFCGTQNFGVMAVNSLCAFLRVDVWKEGRNHSIRFENGATMEPLRVTGRRRNKAARGTCLAFKLDQQFFKPGVEIDSGCLCETLHALACIYPPLQFTFCDKRRRPIGKEIIHHPRGMVEYLERLPRMNQPMTRRPIRIHGARDGVAVDIAIHYDDCLDMRVRCFANGIPNPEGGPHFEGFRKGLLWALRLANARNKDGSPEDPPIVERSLLHGITAVISVRMDRRLCRFESSSKRHLISPIANIVESIVRTGLTEYFASEDCELSGILYNLEKFSLM